MKTAASPEARPGPTRFWTPWTDAARTRRTSGTTAAPVRWRSGSTCCWATTSVHDRFAEKAMQLGSYGGGNHFGECETVEVVDTPRAREAAEAFGLRNGSSGVPVALRLAGIRAPAGQRPVPLAASQVRRLGHPAARRRSGLV